MSQSILFKNHTPPELAEALGSMGCDLPLARRLQGAIVKNGQDDIPFLTQIKKSKIENIRTMARVPKLKIIQKQVSQVDGFAKYLFEGEAAGQFEAVRIPLFYGDERADKYIICVSSQVGCAMGCSFCLTGKMGFKRNLQTWEIVDQIIQIKKDSDHPVRGVVFMGMGEPFLNYDNVLRAASIMSDPSGLAIDAKAITISTVGIANKIRKFAEEGLPYRLVISLTSANHEKRKSILPAEATWPLEELMNAARAYHQKTNRRVQFAWTLISGFNDSIEDIKELARLIGDLPILLDVIDINDNSNEFVTPQTAQRDEFFAGLREHLKMPFSLRYSGGKDIEGACGMLAAQVIDEQASLNLPN